jgi:hypothetical protein
MKSFEAVNIQIDALSVRGEIMRKLYLRILLALGGVAALGAAAKAQEADHIVVKVPYAFVVSGKTLPAGTYELTRASKSDTRALVLADFEDHASSIVLATTIENNYAAKPELTFEQIGGQIFLSQIQTADHLFTIPVSRAEILQASAKSHKGISTAGTTGAAGSASGAN